LSESRPNEALTLWDCEAEPLQNAPELHYRWNGYEESATTHSLFRYVENRDTHFRSKYLAWVHELGETRVQGKRVVDHLARPDGSSDWWVTPLVEQSPWKSPSIMDALRLFALEEILRERRPRVLHVVSGNRTLKTAVENICRSLNVVCETRTPSPVTQRRPVFSTIRRALPHWARALVALGRHLAERWPLRRIGQPDWFGGDRTVFLCSYFFHLDAKACASGQFYTRFWEGLPQLLQANGWHTNWLQHYMRSSIVPRVEIASSWVRRFNEHRHEQGCHCFLDTYLSWALVWRVCVRWWRLAGIERRLRRTVAALHPAGSSFSLWPVIRDDWYESLRGPTAIMNLLWAELFDVALHSLPKQHLGFYLCENQGWERALIHAWRRHGHGRLIGVAHSTVRFWDLRYFKDPRTLRSRAMPSLPQPDLIALNDSAAVRAYLEAGYARETIVECEALRYGYLTRLRALPRITHTGGSNLKVLILGDYWQTSTHRMLELLQRAVPHLSRPVSFTLKPHPNCPVRAQDFPSLRLEVVANPLAEILNDFDVAFSSNLTSAGADAYVAGLPVVVMLEPDDLNFSPLRGQPGVHFVGQPEELAAALQAPGTHSAESDDMPQIFFLDPELPRWKGLLGLTG